MKFLPKKCEREFPQFPHCGGVAAEIVNFYTLISKIFRESNLECDVMLEIDFTEFFFK